MDEQKKPKILLVDDDDAMCESLADILELESEYEISFTTDPFKAIEIIKSEDFALVILDYKMPGMNGIELLKNIKKIKPDTQVYMLTAFISTDLVEQAKKEGAVKVLSKFTWPDKIVKYIKDAVG